MLAGPFLLADFIIKRTGYNKKQEVEAESNHWEEQQGGSALIKWWRKWIKGDEAGKTSEPESKEAGETTQPVGEAIVELRGRNVQRKVVPVTGLTILELAERNEVDWNSFCKRGTCARCRCLVIEGAEHLSEPNLAEERRLDPEEIDEGYRLGCQSKLASTGAVIIKHAPYF